ncbi:MAG: hypothetical protein LIQ31_09525 [Planctomycetes bacterium]|nr:hypothetical protein [Planctomycetota bacterium]
MGKGEQVTFRNPEPVRPLPDCFLWWRTDRVLLARQLKNGLFFLPELNVTIVATTQ